MSRSRYTTPIRVRKYLETGCKGTAAQIAHALRTYPGVVNAAVRDLHARGLVSRLDEYHPDGIVWGVRRADECGPVVSVALRQRTPLEAAWAGVSA